VSQSPDRLAVDVEAQRAQAAYERARDAVLKMTGGAAGGAAAPSAYWREELETIDYMFEASPLVLRKLRNPEPPLPEPGAGFAARKLDYPRAGRRRCSWG